jgi:hypothetical protein
MVPPLTFRLQVVPHVLKETREAAARGERFSSVDVGFSNMGRVELSIESPSDASSSTRGSPVLVPRGLYFATGGQNLGPTLTLTVVTASDKLSLVAMTREKKEEEEVDDSDKEKSSSAARRVCQRFLDEVLARIRAMSASSTAGVAVEV